MPFPLAPFLVLLAPFVFLIFEGKKPREFARALSLHDNKPLPTLKLAVSLFARIFVALLVVSFVLRFLGLFDTQKVVEVIKSVPSYYLFLAVAIAPVGEELLFRGYLQKRFGIVLSSLFFAVLHYCYGSVSEIIAAFVVSILFGLHLRKHNNLSACILAHAAYNLMTILIVSAVSM